MLDRSPQAPNTGKDACQAVCTTQGPKAERGVWGTGVVRESREDPSGGRAAVVDRTGGAGAQLRVWGAQLARGRAELSWSEPPAPRPKGQERVSPQTEDEGRAEPAWPRKPPSRRWRSRQITDLPIWEPRPDEVRGALGIRMPPTRLESNAHGAAGLGIAARAL